MATRVAARWAQCSLWVRPTRVPHATLTPGLEHACSVRPSHGVGGVSRPVVAKHHHVALLRRCLGTAVTARHPDDVSRVDAHGRAVDGASRDASDKKRRCLRITGFDKRTGKYYRCNAIYTDATNTMTCQHHLIGLFDRFGPGTWWNCCQETDPQEPGCMLALHSDDVDDSELRGRSIDPKNADELDKALQ
eukprot:m.30542 g.30542  ORF g.30542 m.30542 type:complete len:191 (-) comp4720_c0_seq1:317-889(-)